MSPVLAQAPLTVPEVDYAALAPLFVVLGAAVAADAGAWAARIGATVTPSIALRHLAPGAHLALDAFVHARALVFADPDSPIAA